MVSSEEYKNYLVKRHRIIQSLIYRDVLKGIEDNNLFPLHEIEIVKKSFAKKIFPIIKEHTGEEIDNLLNHS